MPKVISADMELDIAQRHLADAERKASKCYDHVRDDWAKECAFQPNEYDNSSHSTSRKPETDLVAVRKAQQVLRKWEENLADAQSTVQECTRNVRRAQERMAKNQAI
ncbi:MAG: hypothetical protein Q9226_009458, partial [Calogaya cf. arnoldii]